MSTLELDGWGNGISPEQEYNDRLEPFESDNVQECLDYLKDTKDFEPIENAIITQNRVIENAISELQFVIDAYRLSDNVWLKNRLRKIKRDLELTQKKS